MYRKSFVSLVLFFSIFFSFYTPLEAEENALIPITVGDVEAYKTKTRNERLLFMADYYLKNKQNGLTDEVILNEMLKLFDLNEEQAQKIRDNVATIEKYYQTLKNMVNNAIEEANLSILEKNPGRTDMIIDSERPETWKNIKNVYIGDTKIEDYLKVFKGNSYFSETVISENASAFLASCADVGREKIPMTFVVFPREGSVISRQEEGKPADGIQIDFSKSENVIPDPVLFPMGKRMNIGGKNVLGYENKVYLPFTAKLQDARTPGIIRAQITLNMCQNGVCRNHTLPEVTYATEKSGVDSSFCRTIVQAVSAAPESRRARFELEKASFKKEDSGEVFLTAFFTMPRFFPADPSILIRNEQDLRFAPFVSVRNGRDLKIKARLLNPENLGEKAEITFDLAYSNSAAEFKTNVSFEKLSFERNISFFAFSLSDLFKSFLTGLKFFLLTPVLLAFFMLMNQSLVVQRKTPEKTLEFARGLWKAYCLSGGLFLAFFILSGCFQTGIRWGNQFNSPLFNFIAVVVFFWAVVGWNRLFDDVAVETFSRSFPFVFRLAGVRSVREKAGMIAGCIVGGLLLLTPMTYLYDQTGMILSRSVFLYFIVFSAAVFSPFFILTQFRGKAADTDDNPDTVKFMRLFVPVPLYFQILILVLSVGSEAGMAVLAGVCAIAGGGAILVLKKRPLWKAVVVPAVLAGLIFVPLRPSEKDLNNTLSVAFDENLIHRRLEKGKSVYLNVSESFCWMCMWNRFLAVYKGAPYLVENGELTVMRIGRDEPFLKKLLPSGVRDTLPMNVFFSPAYPEGKIVDTGFDLWSVAQVVADALPVMENVPNLRNLLEEKKLISAEEGID